MAGIRSTRLRSIRARELETIQVAVQALPFKVEIKGSPQKDGDNWVLHFTIPDNIPRKHPLAIGSVDLTDVN